MEHWPGLPELHYYQRREADQAGNAADHHFGRCPAVLGRDGKRVKDKRQAGGGKQEPGRIEPAGGLLRMFPEKDRGE
jgi:hypothetical protein